MASSVGTRSAGGLRVEAQNGKTRVVLDASSEDGGEGAGLSPHETLLSALGGCTTMTLLLYARRKNWPLQGVEVELRHARPPAGSIDAPERIESSIRLLGPLDEEQRARLLEVAKKCPVYRTLTGDLAVEDRLA